MRRDPFAMLPFCGYNMADYFNHWLNVGRRVPNPPRIFRVNWFRKGPTASSCGRATARTCASSPGSSIACTAAGSRSRARSLDARHDDLNWKGLSFPEEKFYDLMAVTRESGTSEAHAHEELFDRFFDRLPKEFIYERELLRSRLWRSPDRWELAHGLTGGV